MGKLFKFQTLAARMNFVLITLMVGLVLVPGLTVFWVMRSAIENSAIQSLDTLASAQNTAINTQLQFYTTKFNVYLQPELVAEITSFILQSGADNTSSPNPASASTNTLESEMRRRMASIPNLERVDLINLDGKMISSTSHALPGTPANALPALEEGMLRPTIADPYPEPDYIALDVLGPVKTSDEHLVAVLLLHFNANNLVNIMGNFIGLGNSGESLLGVRRGNLIYFLTPTRFAPDLSSLKPVPADGAIAQPMLHATIGHSGTMRGKDYRGVPVVAAFRPVESTGWGLVVKQDESEVFTAVRQLQDVLVVRLVFILLVGVIVILPLVNNFIHPLRELEAATQRVVTGDLNVIVPIHETDEVGSLARAFNAMTTELRKTHRDLTRRNEELTSFAYVVSHDLKAPLRGVHSLSEWLEEDLAGKLDTEQLEQIRLMRERVNRMDALISGLLEYSRIGHQVNPASEVCVGDLLERTIATLCPPPDFQINVISAMPILQADELRLGQVFQNLIDNAIKHHPDLPGKVEIACQEAGQFWEFSVSDDGNGIEPRHQERIFQIFQTLHPDKGADSTGIGLAVVKKIIEDQGGAIWVKSDHIPGKGATFIFTWPK